MIIKAYDSQNEEVAVVQQQPAYVKHNLQYSDEQKEFNGIFEIVKGEQEMQSIIKILKYSVDQNLSHFIVENEEGTKLYAVSMLFAKNPTINMNEGNLYIKMDISINVEKMDQYTQFLEKHNLYS